MWWMWQVYMQTYARVTVVQEESVVVDAVQVFVVCVLAHANCGES
jgi:hypothetical protein